jgi:DNA-binding NarL/FixJ family response regulator
MANKEIATKLNVSVKTVEYHKSNIYKKTGTHSATTLYNYALKHKLFIENEEE